MIKAFLSYKGVVGIFEYMLILCLVAAAAVEAMVAVGFGVMTMFSA